MVKKFSYPCSFNNGETHPVTFYVGDSAVGTHPIGFQSNWLAKERGCNVPDELMDSLKKLKDLADEQKVPFEDLCDFVIAELQRDSQKKQGIEESVEEKKQKEKVLQDQQMASFRQSEKQ